LMFFLSPVGTAAVANLISGVGPDYHASANEVLLISGIAGGLLSAAGSFFGGFMADRMSRMLAYALVGVLTAASALYMAFGPHTPVTYGIGYGTYAIAAGIGYAVYTALLLDVVGHGRRSAATTYSFLNASGNVSISYMTWADGIGYKRAGIAGLMGTDAVANAAFAVVLGCVAILARNQFSRGRST